MNTTRKILLAAALLPVYAVLCNAGNLKPSGMFGDNAVLQRSVNVPVWGKAEPGAAVTVTFKGNAATAKTGTDGKWEALLPPMPADNTPATMEIISGNDTVRFENILVGDVWFASGQSNMAYMMKEGLSGGPEELEKANWPGIRFRIVDPVAKSLPMDDLQQKDWTVCTPKTVGDFSAVSYYFAKSLHEDQNVPVGVIVSAVGATGIGCWMSRESLLDYQPTRAEMLAFDTDPVKWEERVRKVDSLSNASGTILNDARVGLDLGVHKVGYDDSAWEKSMYPTDVPKMGYPGFWGLIWARKPFEMTAKMAKQKWELHIPMMVQDYRAYVNGEMIRHGYTSLTDMEETVIEIPEKILNKGENVLALRLWAIWSLAVIGNEDMPCYLLAEDGTKIELDGEWRHNASLEPEVYRMQGHYWFQSTALFNGMVAPVIPYAIAGFLWYQGEANSQWGPAYAEMQPLMTNDWRIRWKQGYLPFLYVQLAAFGTHSDTPQDYDYMAEFRDCQTKIMDMCQNSYMACAIDAGEEQNIHPRRKDVVGERLYATYKENVLGGSAEGDSPRFKSVTRDGNRLIVTFDNAASGLVCKTPEQMNTCVAVCGEDKVWKWANAKIDGSSLIVEIPEGMAPVRIQYAWQGYPDAPLFNEEGFPVLSFNEQINQ